MTVVPGLLLGRVAVFRFELSQPHPQPSPRCHPAVEFAQLWHQPAHSARRNVYRTEGGVDKTLVPQLANDTSFRDRVASWCQPAIGLAGWLFARERVLRAQAVEHEERFRTIGSRLRVDEGVVADSRSDLFSKCSVLF